MFYIPLFGPIPGGPELLIILMVILLLFGANKIPELARASGQAMGEFRRGREEIDQEIRAAAEKARGDTSATDEADEDEDDSEKKTAPEEAADEPAADAPDLAKETARETAR